MIDEKEVTAYVTMPDCFLQGCSEDIVIFRADGGNHFTDYGKETAEHFRSRSSEVPLWHRQNISVEEASGYTGLGRDTIYSLTQEDDCDFVLKVGHRTMIKRKKFENYLENLSSI